MVCCSHILLLMLEHSENVPHHLTEILMSLLSSVADDRHLSRHASHVVFLNEPHSLVFQKSHVGHHCLTY